MTDLLVTNGRVVTQNAERAVLDPGAVAVTGSQISAVGPSSELEKQLDPDRRIDAEGGAVIPGLINTHVHVSDILLRGAFETDRGLHDWLLNVKQPATMSMDSEEHSLAARLYTVESILAGTTTFVENDTELQWDSLENTHVKLDTYDRLGVRSIYGAGITDAPPDSEFLALWEKLTARNPDVVHPEPDALVTETDVALDGVEGLIEDRHDPSNRQSVWPAPVTLEGTSTQGLQRAYRLAEKHDVMTTTHVAEAEIQDDGPVSSIEYLRNIGYLGDHALLGHCVQIQPRDVRLLADTGTRVAHNFGANMRLGTGFAPVVSLLENDVTVGIGTDNTILNDKINPLAEVGAAARAHKGYHRDTGVISPQDAFDMVTIDAAKAIGRAEELGSLEVGTQADIAIIDLDHPHLTPAPDPVHALVYGFQGFEVETVLCGGEILLADRQLQTLDGERDELLANASATAKQIVERTGIA